MSKEINTRLNVQFTQASTFANITSAENISTSFGKMSKWYGEIAKKPGEITTGKQYTIDGQTVTADTGAEVFNNSTYNKASGLYSHAECFATTASGSQSHAEGGGTTASGSYSHSEGCGTTASGDGSHAEGDATTASGDCSHAEGHGTEASGFISHAEGLSTTASGDHSHSEGYNTKASSDNQHVQGKFNVEDANDTYAFIIGNGTADNARHNAFAVDWNGLIYVNGSTTGVDVSQLTPVTVDQTYDGTSANAQSGVAIEGKKPGLKTTGTEYTISGNTVVAAAGAEVFNDYTNNKASGANSHAEGSFTTASGLRSHAEGYYTLASGGYSHVEGCSTTASGTYSHAEGYATRATSSYQHTQGKYNVVDSSGTYAFIIGNGTASARHNAFAVDWNGLIYVNGASTGVDISAFPSPADINTAITKANAAAPQSTTYTKTEIDNMIGNINTVLESVL